MVKVRVAAFCALFMETTSGSCECRILVVVMTGEKGSRTYYCTKIFCMIIYLSGDGSKLEFLMNFDIGRDYYTD